mgnify:CR=1 FL=1
MRWKLRPRSSNIIDNRRFGRKTIGGGLGFIGLAILVGLMGGDPTYLLQEGVVRTIESYSYDEKLSEPEQQELADFVAVVLGETESVWQQRFEQEGLDYPEPQLVLFSGSTESACGYASAAIGPFYCPLNQRIYIDLNFFYELKTAHGAPGDFAQAYVIAHEVGHHIQNVSGLLNSSRRRSNDESVKTELMADCFAGVWAHDTKNLLEDGDIQEALNAASQIGDDRLQEQSQGYVVPDSFTHGTSAQRYEWFQRGYETGSMEACNTFK